MVILRDITRSIRWMETVEFTPTFSQYAWTFGGVEPIMRVKPGTAMRLWTEDAYSGRIRQASDLPSACVDINAVNPQTGPFYVEGAEPGDTLVLHFAALEPARDWGVSTTIPFFGGLTSTDRTATLQDPLPERTWVYHLDRAARTLAFEATSADVRIDLPLEPMLGTVGVAPPSREVRSSLVPERFGGNMDTPEMRAGATCYLGVNVPGAMFSVGDGHYRQGEGEACGTAVEGAMNVTLVVDLIKGHAPAWPRLEHDDAILAVGSSRPLEDAWRIAQVEMIGWLGELYGLDRMDGYQLLSQIARAPIANVVDTNYSSVVKLPKSMLPSAAAYDGVHQHLRGLAAGLA
jgi:acetamidase/formamidase